MFTTSSRTPKIPPGLPPSPTGNSGVWNKLPIGGETNSKHFPEETNPENAPTQPITTTPTSSAKEMRKWILAGKGRTEKAGLFSKLCVRSLHGGGWTGGVRQGVPQGLLPRSRYLLWSLRPNQLGSPKPAPSLGELWGCAMPPHPHLWTQTPRSDPPPMVPWW